jgi:hypothetical protein
MPPQTMIQKLKLKPGMRAAVIHAPEGYIASLGELPEGVTISEKLNGKFGWLMVFVKNKAELDKLAHKAIAALKPEGVLWWAYPKGTSKIQTDLTRDKGWDILIGADLKWLVLISLNDTWSAFAVRPYKAGEERRSFR